MGLESGEGLTDVGWYHPAERARCSVPASQVRLLCVCALSRVQLFATLWTVAHQAPLSREFPRQEYWSGLPFPPPGDLPDPGIEPVSLVSPALADESYH